MPLAVAILVTYSPASGLRFGIALLLIAITAGTDIADGRLARRYGTASLEGYIIDGLGDRAVRVALLLLFHRVHGVPTLLVWAAMFREVAIYAIRIIGSASTAVLRRFRRYSLGYATGIGVWLAAHVALDAAHLLDIHAVTERDLMLCNGTLLVVVVLGYAGLYAQARLLLHDRDQARSGDE